MKSENENERKCADCGAIIMSEFWGWDLHNRIGSRENHIVEVFGEGGGRRKEIRCPKDSADLLVLARTNNVNYSDRVVHLAKKLSIPCDNLLAKELSALNSTESYFRFCRKSEDEQFVSLILQEKIKAEFLDKAIVKFNVFVKNAREAYKIAVETGLPLVVAKGGGWTGVRDQWKDEYALWNPISGEIVSAKTGNCGNNGMYSEYRSYNTLPAKFCSADRGEYSEYSDSYKFIRVGNARMKIPHGIFKDLALEIVNAKLDVKVEI